MKKSSKIIIILLIIVLVAVICAGGVLFIKNKKDSENKISKLENQILEIKNSNELKNVEVATNEDSVNNEKSNLKNDTKNTESDKISNDEALKKAKELYNKAIKLKPSIDVNDRMYKEANNETSEGYWDYVKNIDEIKKVLEDNAFEYFCSEYIIKNYNGKYYQYECDRGENHEYEVYDVSNITNTKIQCKIREKGTNNSNKIEDFIIENKNGIWKVTQYKF